MNFNVEKNGWLVFREIFFAFVVVVMIGYQPLKELKRMLNKWNVLFNAHHHENVNVFRTKTVFFFSFSLCSRHGSELYNFQLKIDRMKSIFWFNRIIDPTLSESWKHQLQWIANKCICAIIFGFVFCTQKSYSLNDSPSHEQYKSSNNSLKKLTREGEQN